MSFANLSGLGVVLGVAGLAGALFLLQRLRVRYQPKRVVTTLFWKEALEEARARVLVRRFRHLLAYLFVLLIASLLWLGFADPQWKGSEDADHVILIDGSAGMAYGDRFERVIEAARSHAASLPRDRRAVLLCGSHIRTLLLPGEHERVLDRRLEGVTPDACPATVEPALRALAHARDAGRSLNVVVAGDAPVRDETSTLLPADVTVSRLTTASAHDDNSGITALGVVSAASGAWDRVDVLAEIHGETSGMTISINGNPLASGAARATTV
ncbi:MAG: VWA domain-containing protein, partial [Planctomycetes bacterium]|nr:VWA domain-containing protein [Planctomycetota bacterium]